MAINDPVPSTAFDVLQRNVQDVDRYLNTSTVFNNRVGLPIKPIPMQAAEWQTAIGSVGWFPVGGDFSTGATLTARNQVIYDPTSTAWYSWGGTLPKTVPAASSPASTGGISAGAWTMRSDAALATALNNGTALINGLPASVLGSAVVLPGVKNLPTAPQDGAAWRVAAFYAGNAYGGGVFEWDASKPKASHNGGTIISPEAISAWDGTPSDVATLLNWTGTGAGCWVKQLSNNTVDVAEFGAVYDGATPSHLSTQKAADLKRVCVVSGPLFLAATVTASNDFYFTDTGVLIHTTQTAPLLHFVPALAPVNIPIAGVTGLTMHSDKLNGITTPIAPNGFIYVDSTERLINRRTGGFYRKQETVAVSDSTGRLSVKLYEDYDTAANTVTLTYYAPEPVLQINNIRIQSNGAPFSVDGLIVVEARTVQINAPYMTDCENTGANIRLEKCSALIIKPKLSGSKSGPLGYGVVSYRGVSTVIFAPEISNCRHGVSGRHDKNTVVCGGGWVDRDIDSHYGYEMHITEGVNVVGDINFAGENITVEGITHSNSNGGIIQRNDGPEIRGRVAYKNNAVYLSLAAAFYSTVRFGSASAFDYGRTLKNPVSVDIENNTYNYVTGSASFRHVWFINPTGYAYETIKKINIKNNSYRNFASSYRRAVSDMVKADNVTNTGANPVITIEGEEFAEVNAYDLRAVRSKGWGFAFAIKNVDYFAGQVDKTCLADSKVRDSTVRLLRSVDQGATPNNNGFWFIYDCDVTNLDTADHFGNIVGSFYVELMPDDSALRFNLPDDRKTGVFYFARQSDNGRTGAYMFQASSPTYSRLVPMAEGLNVENINNTSLTGTTGPDGDVSVSCNEGSIWFENRSGSPSNFYFNITFI